MLDDMMALWRPTALNKGLRLKSQVDPDVPTIMIGDANRIKKWMETGFARKVRG